MKDLVKTLKLLVDIRKGWKSKQLNFARLFTYVPVIDATFFQGNTGMWILHSSTELVHKVPFWMDVTEVQVLGFLVAVGGSAVAYLRQKTTAPIETKL